MIVTIVTPTWNAVEYLKECIESVRGGQTADIKFEHVIVDGGSTDGTVEVAESYGLRVMKGKDRGIFDAINKGSFNSEGELLGFLGADDVLLKDGLPAIVSSYRESGRPWTVGGIRWIDPKGANLGEFAAPPSWMTPQMHASLGWNCIMHMATYFTRDFYTRLGGFNIDFKDAGDYDMFARALAMEPYARVSRTISCFRRTGKNNSAIHGERTRKENQVVADRYGASSSLKRDLHRLILKTWINAANPSWSLQKFYTKAKVELKLCETSYF